MRRLTIPGLVLVMCACSEAGDALIEPPPPPPVTQMCELPEVGRFDLGHSESLAEARAMVADGRFLSAQDFTTEGVYAEHDTTLPTPCCNGPLCLHAEFGTVPDLRTNEPLRVVRVGVNLSDRSSEAVDVRRNLIITVDLSASLRTPESVDLIKGLLGGFIDGLHPDDKLALITFRNQPKLDVPLTSVGTDRQAFHDAVDALEFGGATNLWGGLEGALFHAVSNFDNSRENRVILVTDGRPTWGVSNAAEVVDETYGFVRHGVLLSIVGVGETQVDTLTKQVGSAADGLFFSLTSEEEVEAFVASELDTTWRTVAKELALEITKTAAFSADAKGLARADWDGEHARIERPVLLEAPDGRLRAPGHGVGGGSMITFVLDDGVGANERMFTTRLTYKKNNEKFEEKLDVRVDFDTTTSQTKVFFASDEMEFATLVTDVGRLLQGAGFQTDARAHESALDQLVLAKARIAGYQSVHGSRDDLTATAALVDGAIANLEASGVTPTIAAPVEGWPAEGQTR